MTNCHLILVRPQFRRSEKEVHRNSSHGQRSVDTAYTLHSEVL
jgi:hypothetical protein